LLTQFIQNEEFPPQESYIVDVLLNLANDAPTAPRGNSELPPGVRPPAEGETGKMEVVPILLPCLEAISSIRIFLSGDMKSLDQRNTARKNIEETKRRFGDGIPVLGPVENMKITDDSFKALLRVSLAKIFTFVLLTVLKRKLKSLNLGCYPIHCTIPLGWSIFTIDTAISKKFMRRLKL
jgi:superfamily II RNA helicase